jgi:hypothetical protein
MLATLNRSINVMVSNNGHVNAASFPCELPAER